MQHSAKHRVEYVLACFWIGVFRLLPYRCTLGLGWAAAWLGHYVFRYRRAIVHARIRTVFPDISDARVRSIAWLSWRNLVFNVIDTLRVSRMDDRWLRRNVVNVSEVEGAFAGAGIPAQGVVAVSMHMGCAEVAARLLQRSGADVFVIVKTQKNLLVDQRLNDLRSATGITCLPVTDGLYRQVLKRLHAGQTLAMLTDLRVSDGGVHVDFLGHTASVGPGAALFAKRTGVSMMCAVFTRVGWCRHRIDVKYVLSPDSALSVEEDVQRLMQLAFVEFDKAIRDQPEQWFWYNKKWILG